VNFECDFAEELVTLVQRASRADDIDKGMLCRAATRVIHNPPAAKPYLIGLSVGLRVYGIENAIRSDLRPIPDRDEYSDRPSGILEWVATNC
jgi:hypothetical protein